jgi:hypothetical protein
MAAKAIASHREPWNMGMIVSWMAAFELKDIWALRVRLQMANRAWGLALFDPGIDSKLWGCDQVASRVIAMQQKTQPPMQFEITAPTRDAVQKWIKQAGPGSDVFLFPSCMHQRHPNLQAHEEP